MTPSQRVPAVNVVMPTLNQAGFIDESVRSVMTQHVDALELIVCDGGSTDGTQSLLTDLAAEFAPRLHWASVPDRGPADAVNKAVASSRAPIIGWLNSDDMYAPGAVQRALAHFQRKPTHVMVYGEAEHVDVLGHHISRYPTRPPQTPLAAWADGCHICQPSAFWRRDAFAALGGLDTSLRAAFDFDFWLRLLKAYPGRIGHVPDVQARSRLHADAITMRMREYVALEGIKVVHRHIGPAPLHWLLTHMNELLACHPFHRQPMNLTEHLHALLEQAAGELDPNARPVLDEILRTHCGIRMASEHFGCQVFADGWVPPVCQLRLWQGELPVRAIRLQARHASPVQRSFDIEVSLPEGDTFRVSVRRTGAFSFEIPVHQRQRDARLVFSLASSASFVPAKVERGSEDWRTLAFQIDDVKLV